LLEAEKKMETLTGVHPIAINGSHVGNYVLQVLTEEDGANYTVAVRPQDNKGEAFFSDSQGLIYQGAPLH
jgi:hypothetical protein